MARAEHARLPRVLADEAEEDAADGVRLLADLRDVFGQQDKLWTKTILGQLHGISEAPWGDWYGHPLKDRELAMLLKPYGVRSAPGEDRRGCQEGLLPRAVRQGVGQLRP